MVLCVLACVACLAVIGLRLLDRLHPGDQDDKTLLYASSAVRPGNLGAVAELVAALPQIVAACPVPDVRACRERTTTRVSSLLNYVALSVAIRIARAFGDASAPPCERISLAYWRGILLLHGTLLALVVLLVGSDRSRDGTFSLLVLAALLAAAFPLSGPLVPAPHPAHAIGAYAPRSALASIFLLQVAAYASDRRRLWIALCVAAPLVHAAQSLLFGAVFVVALSLRAVLFADERRAALSQLGFLAALQAAVVLASRFAAAPGAAAVAIDPAGALRVLGVRDLAWLLVAGAALLAARRAVAWRQALVLLAAFLVVAVLVHAVGGALGADPRSASGQLFLRFYSGSSWILGALPWLAATFGVRLLWNRLATRAPASLATAGAVVVLAAALVLVATDVPGVAAAASRARSNAALARYDLCPITRCEYACRFRGFAALRPANETLFHLELYDYLATWPPGR